MTVAELLKKEKGKYTNYELHYKDWHSIPFSHINGRTQEDMRVLGHYYHTTEGLSFGLNLKFKGKTKDKTLVILWQDKND